MSGGEASSREEGVLALSTPLEKAVLLLGRKTTAALPNTGDQA